MECRLVVTGEAGVGKTRLVSSLLASSTVDTVADTGSGHWRCRMAVNSVPVTFNIQECLSCLAL